MIELDCAIAVVAEEGGERRSPENHRRQSPGARRSRFICPTLYTSRAYHTCFQVKSADSSIPQ